MATATLANARSREPIPAPMTAPPVEIDWETWVVGEGPVISAVEEGAGVVPGADATEE
jgi:hypothetical protein